MGVGELSKPHTGPIQSSLVLERGKTSSREEQFTLITKSPPPCVRL